MGRGPAQFRRSEGQCSYEQLVENHAEGIDIGAGIYIVLGNVSLLRTHVVGGADDAAEFGVHGGFGQAGSGGFGQSKVNDLGNGLLIQLLDQYVGGFQIAVDNRFLMRMLHTLTDLYEEAQALMDGEAMPVAVIGNGQAGHVLHDEIWTALGRGSGLKNFGDVGVLHERQGLTL